MTLGGNEKNGFLDMYLKRREEQMMRQEIPKMEKRSQKSEKSNSSELPSNLKNAYSWLVELSYIPYNSIMSKESLVEHVTAKKFMLLFKLAKLFGINVKTPQSDQMDKITHSISVLIKSLVDKSIIPANYNVNQVIRGDKKTILRLIGDLYSKSQETETRSANDARYSVSKWLISLGITPPHGDRWFMNHKTFLHEDPLRNGELLRKILVVFKPETFIKDLPKTDDKVIIIGRVRDSLAKLAEEGLASKHDLQFAEDIVNGSINQVVSILSRMQEVYFRRQNMVIRRIVSSNQQTL